ncbi:hypothetical protein UFOVP212_31 [uncultured Caudovirales phage]|uniref:Uncharacterized protein n=1 Tax=uncultured Caudovirales phage TaxID=2100421 RepID=A0A6J7WKV4_9CAUD|nr:hypothetical protein UFOVP212_31 [uncultured Caudovirales phage]
METKIKIDKSFLHIVQYYKNNKLIKEVIFAEVVDVNKYWNDIKEAHLNYESQCVELDNFVIVTKTLGDYDFCVSKIIEKIININN